MPTKDSPLVNVWWLSNILLWRYAPIHKAYRWATLSVKAWFMSLRWRSDRNKIRHDYKSLVKQRPHFPCCLRSINVIILYLVVLQNSSFTFTDHEADLPRDNKQPKEYSDQLPTGDKNNRAVIKCNKSGSREEVYTLMKIEKVLPPHSVI